VNHYDEIVKAIKAIPSLPAAAVELLGLVKDPDVDISLLVKSLEHDPGLTSNVLRLANSAYYGGTKEINSIRGAIVRLGLKRLSQIVIASAVAPIALAEIKGYDLPAGKLLDHLMGTAICTDQLVKVLKLKEIDYVFTSALLIDIGKIVLGTFVAVDVSEILEIASKESMPFDMAEKQVLGMDHAEAGAILLENWGLPSEIVEIIRYHHEPDNFPGDKLAMDLVHTADNLCCMAGLGAGADGLNYRVSKGVEKRLNLKPLIAEEIVCMTISKFEEIKGLLSR